MVPIFSKTNDLIVKIDNFIDLTMQASLHFKEGLKLYLNNNNEDFEKRLLIIKNSENQADTFRKEIEAQLYTQTLIPESRGDVLGVLESMDCIINSAKSIMFEFSIEVPDIPNEIKNDFIELAEPVIKSVEALTFAARAFFYDINAVKDHLHIVKFYEKEADISAEKTKRKIFKMDLKLSSKIQLKNFIQNIDVLADNAENVANRLSIATIKRIV